MNVTTTTGETVTLVVPFVFANLGPLQYVKAVGYNQWWRCPRWMLGENPKLTRLVHDPEVIEYLNEQANA